MVGAMSQAAAWHAWSLHSPLQHCEPNMHEMLLSADMQHMLPPVYGFVALQENPSQQKCGLSHDALVFEHWNGVQLQTELNTWQAAWLS